MPAPMLTPRRFASPRRATGELRLGGLGLLAILVLSLLLAACGNDDRVTPATPTPEPATTPATTTFPTPSPSPTPAPTPRFENAEDPEVAALIPSTAAGATITVPSVEEFALTPGDVGRAFGEIGDRFATLTVAYAPRPRSMTLYAMRVDGDPVATEDLEPHLAEIGRYVGIAGLHRDPWQLTEAAGHLVWARPEDNATAAGTMVYTWSSGELVFILIGVDAEINAAILGALPGEPAPTPSPAATPAETDEPAATPGD